MFFQNVSEHRLRTEWFTSDAVMRVGMGRKIGMSGHVGVRRTVLGYGRCALRHRETIVPQTRQQRLVRGIGCCLLLLLGRHAQ